MNNSIETIEYELIKAKEKLKNYLEQKLWEFAGLET